MRCVTTRVLPLPGPAKTNSGPSTCSTAARCDSVRPSRRGSKAEFPIAWARLENPGRSRTRSKTRRGGSLDSIRRVYRTGWDIDCPRRGIPGHRSWPRTREVAIPASVGSFRCRCHDATKPPDASDFGPADRFPGQPRIANNVGARHCGKSELRRTASGTSPWGSSREVAPGPGTGQGEFSCKLGEPPFCFARVPHWSARQDSRTCYTHRFGGGADPSPADSIGPRSQGCF